MAATRKNKHGQTVRMISLEMPVELHDVLKGRAKEDRTDVSKLIVEACQEKVAG